ncbi:MAG: hypothetical protein DIU52_008560 [bacterium]|jgi:hypothetical protein|nr:MAG: hypothetical protein DIU52_08075 [bacterium]
MRIALDPVPLVLGIYAHVSEVLGRAAERRAADTAEALGRRYARQREETADREVQQLVRLLHADLKTAEKLLRKTADVWEISRETDLVTLVIHPRGQGPDPRAYVLLRPDEVRALLNAIRDAARGAGLDQETLDQLDRAADAVSGRPSDYLTFGFDPWQA